MKRMAIVSSYAESCGNAAFTKILHDSIEQHASVDVEVLELNLTLLQSVERSVRAAAEAHIDDLCKKLKSFDAVNIQLEAGLYGTLPNDIIRRVRKLIRANKSTSVTLHSPRLTSASQSNARAAIKQILRFHLVSGVRAFLASVLGSVHVRINRAFIRHGIAHKVRFIVHTGRAKKQIKAFYDYDRTDVHPLKFIPDDFLPDPSVLRRLVDTIELPDGAILVGMFGYISAYKGHMDAIAAIEELSPNYHLLIFGRQHPQTLRSDGQVDAYLQSLMAVIKKKKLEKRVLFLGELNDNDFMHVAACVDVAWLPYYENGQDGSGIASICVDACPRVLCSSSFAFDELFKLAPSSNVIRFDIGNSLEIAVKTRMILQQKLPAVPYGGGDYSIRSQALLYAKELLALDD